MRWIMSMSGVHGTWDTVYLRELLCRREEVLRVLRVPRILSFWKRSVSLRFLGVFLCWVFFDLCLWFRLTFCFSPVLLQRESISTTRCFDDRPSLPACTAWAKKNPDIFHGTKNKHFFWLENVPQIQGPHTVPMISDLFRQSLLPEQPSFPEGERGGARNDQTNKKKKLEMTVWAWEPMIYKMSCPWLTLHRMEYCFRWVWEAASASLVLIHSYPRPHVLVANLHGGIGVCCGPQALWPSCRSDKTYITTMGMQQTLSMVELPHAARQAGKTEPGDLLHHRQGLLLDHSGKKGVSSRITFESSGLWKQE